MLGRRKAYDYPGKGIFGKPKTGRRSVVDSDKCTGCGECMSVCIYGRIELDGKGRAKVLRGCVGCGACSSVCPSGAMTTVSVE